MMLGTTSVPTMKDNSSYICNPEHSRHIRHYNLSEKKAMCDPCHIRSYEMRGIPWEQYLDEGELSLSYRIEEIRKVERNLESKMREKRTWHQEFVQEKVNKLCRQLKSKVQDGVHKLRSCHKQLASELVGEEEHDVRRKNIKFCRKALEGKFDLLREKKKAVDVGGIVEMLKGGE